MARNAGVDEAMKAFMVCDYPRLVAALWTVTGDLATAEDLVQEALARLLARPARLAAIDNLPAFVRVAAFNLSRNRWRSLRRGRRAATRLAEGRKVEPDFSAVSDVALDLQRAVSGLSRREREAAALYWQLDLPVSEVADFMGISPGTAKALLHRARGKLAEVLSGAADDPSDQSKGGSSE